MIEITQKISLNEDELSFEFTRSTGPGGQHVNRTESAVKLYFDVGETESISPTVKQRLTKLAGKRMTDDGVLIIEAQRFRSQHRNREDAVSRLVELIRQAAKTPRKRKKTKPSRGARERRLKDKRQRSETKKRRQRPEG